MERSGMEPNGTECNGAERVAYQSGAGNFTV
jgi:hypothetical protein